MTVLSDNSPDVTAMLERSASSKNRCTNPKCKGKDCAGCKAGQSRPTTVRRNISWDERQFRKVMRAFENAARFGIIRTLSQASVKWLGRKVVFAWHVWTFIKTVMSGRVSEQEAAERLAICEECPKRKTIKGHDYCGACGVCPAGKWWWPFAKLPIRVGFKKTACLLGKHDMEV